MRRTLNVKLLAILIASCLPVGVGVHALHGMQFKRSAGVLLAEAGDAEGHGDLAGAAEYLNRYVRYVPDDAGVLARYALLLASEKLATSPAARERALGVAERALARDPGRRDVRRRGVDLALELMRYDTARSHLTTLAETAPDDGEIELLLGRCEENQGQFEAAAAWYEKAIKHAPQQIEAYVRAADVFRYRLNRAARADEVMDARVVKGGLIALNGRSERAYLERSRYRKANGLPGADSDVARALELAPDAADVLLAAAELAGERNDLPAARGYLERGRDRHPRDVRMYERQAALELQAGKFDRAVACLNEGVERLPGEVGLQWILADLLVQGGEVKKAEAAIRRLADAAFPAEFVDYLNGRLEVRAQHWAKAIAVLEGVNSRLVTSSGIDELRKRVNLQLAECYRETGQVDQQFNAALRAQAINLPDDRLALLAHLELTSALALMGRLDAAIDEYRKILALPGAPPQTRIDLAQLLILKNLRLPSAQRRWEDAERLLGEAEQSLPGSAAVVTSRAEVLAARGQLDSARQLLERARDKYPERVELWTTLAVLAERQGKPQDALSILDQAQARLKDRVELRLARARYWESRGGPEAVEMMGRLEQGEEAFAPADRLRLLAGLAALYQRAGNYSSARRLWGRLADEQPEVLTSRIALFNLAFLAGDTAAMKSHLEEIKKIEGDGPLWRFGQVRYLIQRARANPEEVPALAPARSLLAIVSARRPAWSEVALAEAEIDDLQGNPESALRHYLRAVELGNRSWMALHRAVGMLVERGRFEQADRLLQNTRDEGLLSPDLQRLAARISLQTQDYRRALDLARKAVPADARDYRDQIWLGQVLWISARRAEAEGNMAESEQRRNEADLAYCKAVTLSSDQPESWVALVGFQVATGQQAAAEASIKEAQAALPKEKAPLALARCYAAVGRVDQADAFYRDALKAAPDDVATLRSAANFAIGLGRLSDAEPHLRRLITLRSRTPADADWARRILALLLAARGGRQQSLDALELLGLAKSSGEGPTVGVTEPLDELRARARVLAMQHDRPRRREAIRIAEEIVRRASPTPNDLYLLAQLYNANGDWSRCRETLQRLITADGNSPLRSEHLAYYARALLARGEVDEAKVWLGRLEQSQPGSPGAVEIKARVLAATGRGDEAAALLTTFANARDTQVAPAAALVEELHQAKAAEALYRRFAALPGRPEKVLTLAAFLARHGRLSEALGVCEGAWQTCPPEAVANASVILLYTSRPDDVQFRRVESWLDAAIRKAPDSLSLQFDIANLRSLQQRYDEAEAIYRRISAGNRGKASALNNLAWLMAVRGVKAAEALDSINQAITIEGPGPDLLDTRALASLAMGRSTDAIKDLEDALAVAPNGSMYLHLTQARLIAGDRPGAAEAFRAAKAAGLGADALHPLEQTVYNRLSGELALK
jgi:cellulose synthase operon protein C